VSETRDEREVVESLDLRDPTVAAVLAWLVPGLGHLYQRRYAKAVLFFVCIVSTFVYGLALGSVPDRGWYGRTVYFSWRQGDRRLHYICQIGAGLIATPALVQAARMSSGKQVWLGGLMAPPRLGLRDLPPDAPNADQPTAHQIYRAIPRLFELGTMYTMIAGLLNILAIYDAWGGPVLAEPRQKRKSKKEDDEASG